MKVFMIGRTGLLGSELFIDKARLWLRSPEDGGGRH